MLLCSLPWVRPGDIRHPPAYCFFTHRIPGSWLSLRRRPHFRASARSESCSRCSAGLISALPLVPNRAPAAALASFLRFRSFRNGLPLQCWPHFPCHATPTSPGRPAPPLPSTPVPAAATIRPRPPSFSPAHLPADPALIAPGPLWGLLIFLIIMRDGVFFGVPGSL